MSTRHQISFVVAAFVTMLSIGAPAVAEGAHNLILIIPEALPAAGINQSNAPALARLRHEGVNFANSHSGFPRLTPADSFVDGSDLKAEALLAAAADNYSATLISDGRDEAELQRLVTTVLPQAKAKSRPFFIVYQMKEPQGIDNSQARKDVRPAFKPNPRAVNTVLETLEENLKSLDLYDNTNIIVAAEHGFSRVIKVSDTSGARALLPKEETLGVLPAGFLAIDILDALQISNPDLQLFDPDAGNAVLDRAGGDHPKLGNAIIAGSFDASKPWVTVEAHGAYDSVFLSDSIPNAERRAAARLIVDAVLAQDYMGGIFVNEKRLGQLRGALPLSQIVRHREREGLPDIVVIFSPSRERCAPAEECTSVIADTPLVEGEGIANPFSRAGTAIFMAARGPDFRAGLITHAPASNADMSRTIAAILDLDLDASDIPNARVLREAVAGARAKDAPQAIEQPFRSAASLSGLVTELHLQTLGAATYLDSAVSARQEMLADAPKPHHHWRWPFSTLEIKIKDDKF
jgi:hypothetical protein